MESSLVSSPTSEQRALRLPGPRTRVPPSPFIPWKLPQGTPGKVKKIGVFIGLHYQRIISVFSLVYQVVYQCTGYPELGLRASFLLSGFQVQPVLGRLLG